MVNRLELDELSEETETNQTSYFDIEGTQLMSLLLNTPF